jgi:serine protease inhibitor
MRFSRKTIAIAKVVLCFFVLNIVACLIILDPKVIFPKRTISNIQIDFLRSESSLANNHSNVSLTIAKHLFSKESYQDKNMVLSPLSLQVVLSIIAAGSEGPTQQQLLNFLQSKSTDQLNSFASILVSVILQNGAPAGGPHLSFVDGVWVEKTLSLQPSFKGIVSNDYKANLSSVDFKNKVCFYISPLFTTKYLCMS